MKHYVFNIDEYRSNTGHLNLMEHGILRMLLDMYYQIERPIPNDMNMLMRKLSLSSNEQHLLDNILSEFFFLSENGYTNKYCEKELREYRFKCQKNRLNGKQGGRPKKTQVDIFENPNETQTEPYGIDTNALPFWKSKVEVPKLVPCPIMEIVDIYHEVLPELRKCLMVNDQRKRFITSRWRELLALKEFETQREGVMFFRRYFEKVRRSNFLMGKTGAINGNIPFQADLEWLVRPTNFTKVIEGKYK